MRARWFGLLIFVASLVLLASQQASAQGDASMPAIQYGQVLTGELDANHLEILYRLAAQQGDAITITMTSSDPKLVPFLILLDQSQQNVLGVSNALQTGQPSDNPNENVVRLRYVISNTNPYVIKATAVQRSAPIQGKFTILVTLENPTPTPSPTANSPLIAPYKAGSVVKADLNDNERFHMYSLTAHQGDLLTFKITTESTLQAGLYLYSGDLAARLATAELGQRLNVIIPQDGRYFLIVARNATSGAGTFTLQQVQDEVTTSIAPGQSVRGVINNDDAVKTYSLNGKAGQVISARMHRLAGDLAIYVYIVATSSGKVLAQANSSGEAILTLPADGTYAVVATRIGQAAGQTGGIFALSVSDKTQLPTPPSIFKDYKIINYGDRVSGAIDDQNYAAPYLLYAEAGEVIDATMTPGTGLIPYLLLQDAEANTIAQSSDAPAHLQYKVAQSGYFALLATRVDAQNGKSSGKFDLSLNAVDSSTVAAGATPSGSNSASGLIAGQSQAGRIGPQIGNVYTFQAAENTSVQVNLNTSIPIITLLTDAEFHALAVTGGPIRKTALPASGLYHLIVIKRGGPTDPTVGDYTLTLQGSSDATVPLRPSTTPQTAPTQAATGSVKPGNKAIPTGIPTMAATSEASSSTAKPGVINLDYGGSVSGSINAQTPLYYYSFQGSAGDIITIQMGRTSVSDLTMALYLYVYNQGTPTLLTGAQASTKADADQIAITTFKLPQTGSYLIVATRVGANQGTTSGNFLLKLSKGG